MFTVRNTLAGAVLCALFIPYLLFAADGKDGKLGVLAAGAAMQHVWFLLGHLHLKKRAKAGMPAVWPFPSS